MLNKRSYNINKNLNTTASINLIIKIEIIWDFIKSWKIKSYIIFQSLLKVKTFN